MITTTTTERQALTRERGERIDSRFNRHPQAQERVLRCPCGEYYAPCELQPGHLRGRPAHHLYAPCGCSYTQRGAVTVDLDRADDFALCRMYERVTTTLVQWVRVEAAGSLGKRLQQSPQPALWPLSLLGPFTTLPYYESAYRALCALLGDRMAFDWLRAAIDTERPNLHLMRCASCGTFYREAGMKHEDDNLFCEDCGTVRYPRLSDTLDLTGTHVVERAAA